MQIETPVRGPWGTMRVDENGHLSIGGCDLVDLAARYGTPLVVYDEQWLRERIRCFRAVQRPGWTVKVSYAAKAFCTLAMCQLVAEEGLGLDVVSGGELFTALKAGVEPAQIHMHGNNKTWQELAYAVESGIGLIIVDNAVELNMLAEIAERAGRVVDILIRVAPGVEAHTHDFISTGQQDSKFGFDLASGQADDALQRLAVEPRLRCVGLHSHIGSQIFEADGFTLAIQRMGQLYARGLRLGLPLRILNVGGGFGIRYTEEDQPQPIVDSVDGILDAVAAVVRETGIPQPEVWLEPGRSIVGPAGTTLYTLGTQKRVPGVRNYVSIDGGMSDNPRLALYGAKYDAVLANRAKDTGGDAWAVAGKCCESGDMLIWDAELPNPQPGDLLAVFSTGAYTYSMASHYNRNPKPAVVFVRDGQAQVVVERETWADLVQHDRLLQPWRS
ncbi:MAG: diaminopimelate decarboxylase [Alicyclobacillus sp.]|nr:diaminopimelate decarboxylase [Alicyclobacillus sp.]